MIYHTLIAGTTGSGKTVLAQALANRSHENGSIVLVYDPIRDPNWKCSVRTDDKTLFLRTFWTTRNCTVFIDEASTVCTHHAQDWIETATRGRHQGHRVTYITQRIHQLSPNVRNNCGRLFLFCSSLKDGQIHSQDWVESDLENCVNLKVGEFYTVYRMGDCIKQKLLL